MTRQVTTADDLRDLFAAAVAAEGAPSSDYDLNREITLPEGRRLRDAAVLIGVAPDPTGARLFLTKRSSRLKHHPGQIAFPGGKLDPDDADLAACALREAKEEIGLPETNVDIIGTLPAHETVTSFTVTPVLGVIREPFEATPEVGEVAEVFTVPLTHVLDRERYRVERRRWRGVWRHFYVVPFGPYYIWGATARMLRALADRVA